MDGKKKEKIFTYTRKHTHYEGSRIVFDDENVYIKDVEEDFWTTNTCICRVPLYGGKIQRIVDDTVLDIAFNDNKIYYIDSKDMQIYCKKLNATSKAKRISHVTAQRIYFANNCLMVEGYNSKEQEVIKAIDENDTGLNTDYIADYYWMTPKGKIIKVIKGSGLKKEDYDLYEMIKE